MKKVFKCLGIIAIAALVGLSITACDEDTYDSDDVPKFITVNSIPAEYNGKWGYGGLAWFDADDELQVVGLTGAREITGGSLSLQALNEDRKPFTGIGDFVWLFFIHETNDDFNNPEKQLKNVYWFIKIQNETTIVTWDSAGMFTIN